MNAEKIIKAIRARGSDATDLRDAAHEAHHALDAKAKKWDRESIHRALMRRHRCALLRSEVMARAVEQIVCTRLGVDPKGDVEKWALVACLESIKYGLPHTDPSTFAAMVCREMSGAEAIAASDAVIALGSVPRKGAA